MLCKQCGKQIDDNANFCPECGAKAEAEPAPVPEEKPAPVPEEKPAPVSEEKPAPVPEEKSAPVPEEKPAPVSQEKPVGAFCPQCGAAVDADAEFCPSCGERLGSTGKKPLSKKAAIAVIAGIVIAAVIGIVIFMLSGRSARATVTAFMDAVDKGSTSAVIKLIPPDVLDMAYDDIIDSGYADNRKEAREYMEDTLKETLDSIDAMYEYGYGKGYKLSYKIEDEDKLSRKELSALNKEYRDSGIDGFKASAGTEMTLEVTVSSRDRKRKNETETDIPLIKVGRNWYLDISDMSDSFGIGF